MKTTTSTDAAASLIWVAVIGKILCFPWTATGQDLKVPPPQSVLGTERVSSALVRIVRDIPHARRNALTKADRDGLRERAKAHRIKLRDDDKIFVEIIGPADGQIDRDLDLKTLEALGVEIGRPLSPPKNRSKEHVHHALTRTAHRAEAWLPQAAIERMEVLLPKGYRVQPVPPMEHDEVVGEGPTRTNSASYGTGGANGAGLTIAVIDGNFVGLTAARNNGDAPTATLVNYTTDTANFEGGPATAAGRHGTGCVEAAFDHAPGATWRLYRIDSPADYKLVVDDCILNGVDIISHSLSQYNQGWGDDTGIPCQEANRAAQNGILFFTSAGNRAASHYEGQFVDTDGGGWHEFAPGDETIDVTIGMNTGGSHYLSWSNPQSDFDFFLYDSTLTNVLAMGTNAGGSVFEELSFTNTGAQAVFHLVVRHRGGPTNSTIEIFSHNSATWNEYIVAAGSNTSPSNATHLNVIVVGAVTQARYGDPEGSNVIAGYSSRGPSNSGMTLPDICGPTDTTGFTYPGGFGGTSSATPNAAGAACAFWSADRDLVATGIRWLLLTQADLWRDWGMNGVENTYGAGGLRLIDYKAGTRWLARNYVGTLDDGTVPFHSVAGAHGRVPNGGRLLMFGTDFGTFPETVQLGNTGKSFSMEVVPNTSAAKLGE